MDHLLPSSPQREHASLQDDEMEQIASQMDWDNEGDVGVESGDDEGPRVGQVAWIGGQWHVPIDPHPFPPRESRSRSDIDLDYFPNQSQVMTTRLLRT
jgi:hypothetical protein